MKTTGISRERTLVNNVPNKSRAREKSEWVEQLVNLQETKLSKSNEMAGEGNKKITIVYATYG